MTAKTDAAPVPNSDGREERNVTPDGFDAEKLRRSQAEAIIRADRSTTTRRVPHAEAMARLRARLGRPGSD